jgi:hypothetical protein
VNASQLLPLPQVLRGRRDEGRKIIELANNHRRLDGVTPLWKNLPSEQDAVVHHLERGTPEERLVALLALDGWKSKAITADGIETRLRFEAAGLCSLCGGSGRWPDGSRCERCTPVPAPAGLDLAGLFPRVDDEIRSAW